MLVLSIEAARAELARMRMELQEGDVMHWGCVVLGLQRIGGVMRSDCVVRGLHWG